MNHNEEKAINAAAADGEQAMDRTMDRMPLIPRSEYVVIVMVSVVRSDEAERIRDDIYQRLGSDGLTGCDLGGEIRPLTDQEWKEFQEQLACGVNSGVGGICQRCGAKLNDDGYCTDETCPFSDHPQTDDAGWYGHPQKDLQG
jgi:hypothetical protein